VEYRAAAGGHTPGVTTIPRLPLDLAVPDDRVSRASWSWAERHLPRYLLAHSVRAYAWAAALGRDEGLAFDAPVLWSAALLHDGGLTRIPRNRRCFEFQGAETARRFLVGAGMAPAAAETAARAIELHKAPGVTIADGAEAVLLDRATAIDVRGAEFERIAAVAPAVVDRGPRGDFDRWFLAAIRREVERRPGCQSQRLLHGSASSGGLAEWMARSPWRRPLA
jgi:hypothetical protein